MSSKIDVVVPVYNEEEGLSIFYQRIKKVPLDIILIFVDNASTDRTVEILENFGDVKIIKHKTNEGYGASLRDGILNSKEEIVAIIDADCEYPPESMPDLIKELENESVVYMSRFLDGQNTGMPVLKKFGNILISKAFNILFKQNVTDLYTGSKAFRRKALDGIELKRNGFEQVLEMAVKFSRKGIKIKEIPVKFEPRSTGRSSMKHIPETLKYFWLLIYYFLKVKN